MIHMPPDLATRSKQGVVDTHAVSRPEDLEKRLLLADLILSGHFMHRLGQISVIRMESIRRTVARIDRAEVEPFEE